MNMVSSIDKQAARVGFWVEGGAAEDEAQVLVPRQPASLGIRYQRAQVADHGTAKGSTRQDMAGYRVVAVEAAACDEILWAGLSEGYK